MIKFELLAGWRSGNAEVCLAKPDLALLDKTLHNLFVYYVYLLHSLKQNRFYVGYSTDLKTRFVEHNSGRVGSTKFYAPWELLYYEAYRDKPVATKREKELKNHVAKSNLIAKLGFEAG